MREPLHSDASPARRAELRRQQRALPSHYRALPLPALKVSELMVVREQLRLRYGHLQLHRLEQMAQIRQRAQLHMQRAQERMGQAPLPSGRLEKKDRSVTLSHRQRRRHGNAAAEPSRQSPLSVIAIRCAALARPALTLLWPRPPNLRPAWVRASSRPQLGQVEDTLVVALRRRQGAPAQVLAQQLQAAAGARPVAPAVTLCAQAKTL